MAVAIGRSGRLPLRLLLSRLGRRARLITGLRHRRRVTTRRRAAVPARAARPTGLRRARCPLATTTTTTATGARVRPVRGRAATAGRTRRRRRRLRRRRVARGNTRRSRSGSTRGGRSGRSRGARPCRGGRSITRRLTRRGRVARRRPRRAAGGARPARPRRAAAPRTAPAISKRNSRRATTDREPEKHDTRKPTRDPSVTHPRPQWPRATHSESPKAESSSPKSLTGRLAPPTTLRRPAAQEKGSPPTRSKPFAGASGPPNPKPTPPTAPPQARRPTNIKTCQLREHPNPVRRGHRPLWTSKCNLAHRHKDRVATVVAYAARQHDAGIPASMARQGGIAGLLAGRPTGFSRRPGTG